MKNIHILFVGGAKRYSAAKALIETGKNLNLNIHLFSYEMGFGLPIEDIATVIQGKKFSDPEVLDHLKWVINEYQIQMAIPYHDSAISLLAQLSDTVFVPTCSVNRCHTFFSKKLSNSYFHHLGMPVAGFSGKVPAIAKPDKGSASKGLLIFRQQEELQIFLSSSQKEEYEIQNWIDGTEYSVDGYISQKRNFHFFAPRIRLETLGGEAVRSKSVLHKEIDNACQLLLNDPEINGAITIQFIEDKKTKKLATMEINPRFGGGMLTTWGAGVPWFEILLCDYLELPFPQFQFKENTLMVRSFREHFFHSYE